MKLAGDYRGMPRGSLGGLFAIFVLLVLHLVLFQVNISRLLENERRVIDGYAQLTLLQELRTVVRDAESAERGFLISGDPEYLRHCESAAERAADAVKRLEELATRDVAATPELDSLRQAVDAKIAEMQMAVAVRNAAGFEAAQKYVASGHEPELMNDIRELIKRLRDQKVAVVQGNAAAEDNAVRLAVVMAVTAGAIGIGLVGLAFILFRRDFMRQRRADETSRRLAAIVESSDDAIIGETVEGIITSWNAGATEIFGYEADEMVGRSTARLIPPPLVLEDEENLAFATRGIHVQHYETQRMTKDGRLIDVSLNASPVKDPAGRVIGIASIARDVTEQKALQRSVLEIAGQEQRRIGQDLHDGTGQELTGLAMLSQRLLAMLEDKASPQAKIAAKIAAGLEDALWGVRILSRGLVPVQLDREGLMSALANLAARTSELYDVVCTFQCDEPVCIPNNDVATQLYRMSQEAVTNAIKHGAAENIVISLSLQGDRVTLKVIDDGAGMKGFRPSAALGTGLRIMRYRAQLIGATLDVFSRRDCGVEVACSFICKRSPSDSCEPVAFHCAASGLSA